MGRAAKNGILIKGGDTIEAVANTKYVVFDKTGTLTTGKFKINEIKAEPGVDMERVRGIIIAIEERSNHPIAKSLVATKPRYRAVEARTGVPWFVIAVIHERESGQNCFASLAQGDPWNRVSVHVPPPGVGPSRAGKRRRPTPWLAALPISLVTRIGALAER